MLFKKREFKPLNQRPLPPQGFAESVIPERNLKQTKDGPAAKVPAFSITAKVGMFWNGCCVSAGLNLVDVERFEKLPRKTRLAVRQQIVEGNFEMRGYSEALKALEGQRKAAEKKTAEKPSKEEAAAKKAREASAAEIVVEDEEELEVVKEPSDDPSLLG